MGAFACVGYEKLSLHKLLDRLAIVFDVQGAANFRSNPAKEGRRKV
jgi:hypothetical protein